jgi:hypothetical protein
MAECEGMIIVAVSKLYLVVQCSAVLYCAAAHRHPSRSLEVGVGRMFYRFDGSMDSSVGEQHGAT